MAFPAGAQNVSGRSIPLRKPSLFFPHSLITVMLPAVGPHLMFCKSQVPLGLHNNPRGSLGRRGEVGVEDEASQLCALGQNITHLPGAWLTHLSSVVKKKKGGR